MASSYRLVLCSSLRNLRLISCFDSRCASKLTSRTSVAYFCSFPNALKQIKSHEVQNFGKDKVNQISNQCIFSRSYSVATKLTEDAIAEKVMNVCKTFDKIPADTVTLDSHFMTDLGLDSLDHVELLMNIEEEFNFEIPDADAEKLLRPKDIVAYVLSREESIA